MVTSNTVTLYTMDSELFDCVSLGLSADKHIHHLDDPILIQGLDDSSRKPPGMILIVSKFVS